VSGLEIRIALVVEIVKHPDEPPQLLVLAEAARVGTHRGLHGEHVPAQ
jgi:hypothetical protein